MSTFPKPLAVLCLLLLSLTRLCAAFPNAWQITDSSTAAGSAANYRTNLLTSQYIASSNAGWRYTVNARLSDDFGGAESMSFFYSIGTNRFSVFLDLDSGGNLVALFPTNGGPTTTLTLTANANAARAYHTHEIVYTPATKLATYSFDGTVLRTWSGDGSTGTIGQVFWGAASDVGQGQLNFRLVQFRIANTNVAIYDAGSSVTNRPVALDPASRGWTFSGLGTGTATNAISPDPFWQPTVVLNGPNPFITPWTLPFTDPGAKVSASPVSLEGGRFHSLALKADGTVAG